MAFNLRSMEATRTEHIKIKRICSKCGKVKTDAQFFNSPCFRNMGKKKEGQHETTDIKRI